MPAKEKVFLAVDLGASSGRVVAGLFDGGRLRLEEVYRFPNGPILAGGAMYWDILALWKEVQTGLRAASARYSGRIESLGVDTWGVDFALLGRGDELLGNPYHYRDRRTAGMLDRAFGIVPRETIFAETGLQFMEFNTLYQLVAMKLGRNPLLEMAEHLLMIPDLFHWLLTGDKTNEFTDVSTMQLYNPQIGGWSENLIEQFGLPRQIFGQIIQPGTELGPLRKSVVEATGLAGIRVIAPGTHDTASAVMAVPAASSINRGATPGLPSSVVRLGATPGLPSSVVGLGGTPGLPSSVSGSGATAGLSSSVVRLGATAGLPSSARPNWCYISSGTWSLMGVEVAQPVINARTSELNFTNEGGIGGTIRLLKNIAGLWLVQECRRIWAERGHEFGWDALVHLAEESPPLASLIDPNDPSFTAPADMPQAIRDYCSRTGQSVPQSEGAIVRAALESLALRYRMVLGYLEELTGGPIETIHIVGGGSQNRLLNQFAADATRRRVIAGPVEATALGNLTLQAVASGALSTISDARELVRHSFDVVEYVPKNPGPWDEAWGRFQKLVG